MSDSVSPAPAALRPSLSELFLAFVQVSLSGLGSAPPKPDSETCTKARKSSLSEGRRAAGAGETESDMGRETYRAHCRPARRVAAGRECVNRRGSPTGGD